jgi:hypothetical protein
LSNLWAAFHISNTLVCHSESKFNVLQHFLNFLQIRMHNTFTSTNTLSHLWPLQLVEVEHLLAHNGKAQLLTKAYRGMSVHHKVMWTMRLIPVGSDSSDERLAVLHRW